MSLFASAFGCISTFFFLSFRYSQRVDYVGLLKTIQTHVRFARARFGMYDTIEFVIVLLGYARSFERTLDACYARLFPLVEVCMALFDRERLPDRSTLSRFFSAPGRTTVKALRTQFQTDRLARIPFTSVGGGLFKTQVQPVVNAVAINLVRIDAVLTRTSLHEPSARES